MKLFNVEVKYYLLLLLPLLLVMSGCDDNDSEEVTLSTVSITPSAVTDPLPVGVTQQFTAIAEYSDGARVDVTSTASWASSDAGVATINTNGLAAAATPGTTNISATSGVVSNTVALTVASLNLVSITATPATVPNPLPEGRTQQFNAEGLFDNNQTYDITNYVTWASDNLPTATISQTGVATAVAAGAGPANISASTTTPLLVSNQVVLTVTAVATDSVQILPGTGAFAPLPIWRAQEFVAFLRLADGTLYNITNDEATLWQSSDTNLATVVSDIGGQKNGTVRAFGETGTVNITATDRNTGLIGAVSVPIVEEEITGVIIKPGGPVDLPVVFTQAYTAEGTFSDGINRKLFDERAWKVTNPSIANFIHIFSREGLVSVVQGIKTGSVEVIYEDVLASGTASGVSGSSTLNVTPAILKTIKISPETDFDMPVNAVLPFVAIGTYTDGSVKEITADVTWVSQNIEAAAFGPESGRLTALSDTAGTTPGTTVVLATQEGINSSASPTVTVTNATLQTIYVGPQQPETVAVGEIKQLTAVGTYSDGTNFNIATQVNWLSNDPAIATVSNITGEEGQITGVMPGLATVTATDPVSGVFGTVDVAVSE